jgi:hypothetical protein
VAVLQLLAMIWPQLSQQNSLSYKVVTTFNTIKHNMVV